MTRDAFYTSKIGIADLQYTGNITLRKVPGCPANKTKSENRGRMFHSEDGLALRIK